MYISLIIKHNSGGGLYENKRWKTGGNWDIADSVYCFHLSGKRHFTNDSISDNRNCHSCLFGNN